MVLQCKRNDQSWNRKEMINDIVYHFKVACEENFLCALDQNERTNQVPVVLVFFHKVDKMKVPQ